MARSDAEIQLDFLRLGASAKRTQAEACVQVNYYEMAMKATATPFVVAVLVGFGTLTLCGAEVDVTDFGAVADGQTDSLGAIQKAIDTLAAKGGGVVRFPKSDQPYLVSGTIVVRSSRIELSGPGATIQLADGAADGTRGERTTESQVHVILVSGKKSNPITEVTIRDLRIDANIYRQKDYYNPRALVVEHATHVLVQGVKILRTFVGLDIGAGSSHCEVRDCVVEDWTEDAFDASGDADKGSGVITTHVRFVNCHARGAPNSTGNGWEIEDGVRHIRVEDCSVSDVPHGNAFGIRNHWTAGPVVVSRDIELRRVRIKNVGGKYGIYSHSAPRDRFPTNRLTDVRLVDVECPAPVLFYGPLENVEIVGGRFGALHLGFGYGAKTSRQPGDPEPLLDTTVRIRDLQAAHINLNAEAGAFEISNVLVDSATASGGDYGIQITGGSQVRIVGCTVTGAHEAAIALNQSSPHIENSILWGNPQSILLNDAKPSFLHCCVQRGTPPHAVDKGGNFSIDPLFVDGPAGRFYLAAESPCVDAGSALAAFLGLDEFTTRPDSMRDTGKIDLGFHYIK